MPMVLSGYQENFEWRISQDGLPIAPVEKVGDGFWINVCPICGCTHILPANQNPTGEYIPPCVRPASAPEYRNWRESWLARWTGAAEYSKCVLIEVYNGSK